MPNGAKYWRMKYRFNDKEKRLALGVYPETGLKDVRTMRAAARKLLTEGSDPSRCRKENKQRVKTASATIAQEWHDKESHEWCAQYAKLCHGGDGTACISDYR